jgi:hypothetical protein
MSILAAILFTILIYLVFAYVQVPRVRWISGSLMFIGLIASVLVMMTHF